MSLILEALKQSEKEQQRRGERPLIDAHDLAIGEKKAGYWPWLFAAVVLLALLVYFVWQKDTRYSAISPPSAEINVLAAVSNKVETATLPVAESEYAAEVKLLYQKAVDARQSATDVKASVEGENTSQEKNVAAVDGSHAVVAAENANHKLYLALPDIYQLSKTQRESIASIHYSSHGYSRQTTAGFVVLNGRPVGINEQVFPGLRVVDILPQGIVLDYKGQLFKLQALNSWINL